MPGNSNVGNSSVYEAGDQRNVKESERDEATKYEQGQPGAHLLNDPKDQRSISNRAAAEKKQQGSEDDFETAALKKDPTLPARLHGNEPSKGAKIDAQIAAEEEQELKNKGKA
ncbi:uncharacterized protein UV8b_02130 [Ustilaginoidea virens]|uniref:Uncharacterized protein n=1 Tax=Ustilaginoidea virens TaxID=1159556 RepID=A0A1B5L713_USTVR|nr:uncharacterized protein UV8b_02130 [Ustilaginoidea virens]QUC17889.1 hypothetical protein UV8b_02130 [Ustilaginoidea virens]GAO19388.1 hypothetical protein UVI_02052770 [Ustilaginoidea virens]